MDHETTAPLLSDLLAGRLPPDLSGEAWSHVGACPDCRSVATAMHDVRQSAASLRGTAWDEHPPAADLVDYALDDDELAGNARTQVDDHLRTCPSCLREVQLTREAHSSVMPKAGRSRRADSLFRPTPAWAAALVTVAIVSGLALPAYRGLVVLPKAQQARENLSRQVESLRHQHGLLQGAQQAHEEERSRLQRGGAVPLLYLGDTARGPNASPSVALRPGQVFQPIVIDAEVLALSSQQEIAVSLRRLPEGAEVWSHRSTWSRLRDESPALTLLVPAAVLPPGEYRLDVRRPGHPQPVYTAGFRVRAAAGRSR